MTNEPDSDGADTGSADTGSANTGTGSQNVAAHRSRAFAPRPNLGRGFDAYTQSPPAYPTSDAIANPLQGRNVPTPPFSRKNHSPASVPAQAPPKSQRRWLGWLTPWRTKQSTDSAVPLSPDGLADTTNPSSFARPNFPLRETDTASAYSTPPYSPPAQSPSVSAGYSPNGVGQAGWPQDLSPNGAPDEPIDGAAPGAVFAPPTPKIWERQPYAVLLRVLLVCGAFTGAWVFGVLVAQVLPGPFRQPPLQERFLRKSSRLTHRLWHLSSLWHTPTEQVRIDAIPLPETGPIVRPVELSPLERQPLLDELSAVETEIVTLDRRLQSLERQLGKPPYQGAGLESRINTMRTAIDPPARDSATLDAYEPVAVDPREQLLDVVKLKISLPGDALFGPGEPELRDVVLLERVLDQLVAYPDATISVRIHSDDQVSAIASREYTLAQANTLARYLQANLPTPNRWITVGMGSAQPLVDNADAAKRQRNRRVEILVDTR